MQADPGQIENASANYCCIRAGEEGQQPGFAPTAEGLVNV
jgi:hypothetical protein